jgi:hypothetical protein
MEKPVERHPRLERLIERFIAVGERLQGQSDEPISGVLIARQGSRIPPKEWQMRRQGRQKAHEPPVKAGETLSRRKLKIEASKFDLDQRQRGRPVPVPRSHILFAFAAELGSTRCVRRGRC